MQDTIEFQPAMTLLNATGDVTITWDAKNKDAILELVREKMKEGYAFFVLTPRRLLPGTKKVDLAKAKQKHLDKAIGVVVPDDVVAAVLPRKNLDDPKVEALVAEGKATLSSFPGSEDSSVELGPRVRTAEDILQNQTAAVRRVVGG